MVLLKHCDKKKMGATFFFLLFIPHISHPILLFCTFTEQKWLITFCPRCSILHCLRALKTETYFSKACMRLGSVINCILSLAIIEQLSWNSLCGLTPSSPLCQCPVGARARKLLIKEWSFLRKYSTKRDRMDSQVGIYSSRYWGGMCFIGYRCSCCVPVRFYHSSFTHWTHPLFLALTSFLCCPLQHCSSSS